MQVKYLDPDGTCQDANQVCGTLTPAPPSALECPTVAQALKGTLPAHDDWCMYQAPIRARHWVKYFRFIILNPHKDLMS